MALSSPAFFVLWCPLVLGVLLTTTPLARSSALKAAPSFAASTSFTSSLAAPSFAASTLPTTTTIFPAGTFSTTSSWIKTGFITTPFGTPKTLTPVVAQKMDSQTLAKLVNAGDLDLLDKPGLSATERLYDQGSFRNWNIIMAQKDIDAMNANPTAETKYPCSITSNYGAKNAKTFTMPSLSCRYKGSVGSLRMCIDQYNRFNGDCRKLSWAVDTDGIKPQVKPLVKNGTKKESSSIHGATNFIFGGCPVDWSMMSERMSYSLLNAVNVTASLASHSKLFLNGKFLGVYSFVQPVDTVFARERFLGDKSKGKGALYKEVWFNQYGMKDLAGNRHGGSDADDTYMRSLMAIIDSTPLTQDAATKMFNQYFDVNSFIDVTALNSVVGSTDDWRQRHNLYWYIRDGSTGKKLVLIPWDYDRLYDEKALSRGALNGSPWWDIQATATPARCNAPLQSAQQLAAESADSPSEIARWTAIFQTLPPDSQIPVTCDKFTKLLSLAFGDKVKARTKQFLNLITLDQIRSWFATWNSQISSALAYDPDGPTVARMMQDQSLLINHLTSARTLALTQSNMGARSTTTTLSFPMFRSG